MTTRPTRLLKTFRKHEEKKQRLGSAPSKMRTPAAVARAPATQARALGARTGRSPSPPPPRDACELRARRRPEFRVFSICRISVRIIRPNSTWPLRLSTLRLYLGHCPWKLSHRSHPARMPHPGHFSPPPLPSPTASPMQSPAALPAVCLPQPMPVLSPAPSPSPCPEALRQPFDLQRLRPLGQARSGPSQENERERAGVHQATKATSQNSSIDRKTQPAFNYVAKCPCQGRPCDERLQWPAVDRIVSVRVVHSASMPCTWWRIGCYRSASCSDDD